MEDAVSAHLLSNLLRERRAREPNEEQQPDEDPPEKQKLEKRKGHRGHISAGTELRRTTDDGQPVTSRQIRGDPSVRGSSDLVRRRHWEVE